MKNILFLILFSGIILTSFSFFPPPKEQRPPNIIFILADDLGYGDLKSFNPESKIPTPHLNQLAEEGIIFTDAHTTSSVCTPSRYSLLTGRYNWRSRLKQGVLTGESQALISKERTTVASLLKSRGYQTAFVGKWHLGMDWALKVDSIEQVGEGYSADFNLVDFSKPVQNGPNVLGFDYSYALPASLDMAPYVYVENDQVTQIPSRETIDEGEYSWWRKGPTSPDFIHEDVTPNFFERTIQYIQSQSSQEKPFFLYLALPSPHTPVLPSDEWKGKSGLLPYADFVMMMDDYVGKVNQALKEAGLDQNTLLIFSSDNGCSPAAGFEKMVELGHFPSAQFRGHKADIYEGGHRVPFFAKWPAVIKKGSVSNETISLIDFFATAADLSGYFVQDHEGEDSYSLLPLFRGERRQGDFREATVFHSVNGSFAIRKGDWKLILAPGSGGWSFPRPGDPETNDLPPVQLYNLATDPGEKINLEALQAEKVKELRALLSRYIREGRSIPGASQVNDPTDGEWKQVWFLEGN